MKKLLDTPWMNKNEIGALTALIERRQVTRVLEWGGGGSTLYWPRLFPDIEWLTIEHDPRYAEAIRTRMTSNVTLLERLPPAYYDLTPEKVGTFDLILVDGLGAWRVTCLDRARRLLSPDGVAVLHDAANPRHDAANDIYNDVRELCKSDSPRKRRRGLRIFRDPKGVS